MKIIWLVWTLTMDISNYCIKYLLDFHTHNDDRVSFFFWFNSTAAICCCFIIAEGSIAISFDCTGTISILESTGTFCSFCICGSIVILTVDVVYLGEMTIEPVAGGFAIGIIGIGNGIGVGTGAAIILGVGKISVLICIWIGVDTTNGGGCDDEDVEHGDSCFIIGELICIGDGTFCEFPPL